jgi:acyl-CoA thioesterase-2
MLSSATADLTVPDEPDESDIGQVLADRMLALFDLEPIEKDIFRGRHPAEPNPRGHVFGGQVAAQALMAAGRTVEPERAVHSLHAYFIRAGDASVPIVFTVDRIRDGRSFTTRRVVAIQHGQGIFALEASFQLDQAGVDFQAPMPDSPTPQALTGSGTGSAKGTPSEFEAGLPFEIIRIPRAEPPPERRTSLQWLRARGQLPDDPLIQACALTYASDLIPGSAVIETLGIDYTKHDFRMASLDHAVWFHRPGRVDDWLLVESDSMSASGARALVSGRVFARDGVQVATIVQELMIRVGSGH